MHLCSISRQIEQLNLIRYKTTLYCRVQNWFEYFKGFFYLAVFRILRPKSIYNGYFAKRHRGNPSLFEISVFVLNISFRSVFQHFIQVNIYFIIYSYICLKTEFIMITLWEGWGSGSNLTGTGSVLSEKNRIRIRPNFYMIEFTFNFLLAT